MAFSYGLTDINHTTVKEKRLTRWWKCDNIISACMSETVDIGHERMSGLAPHETAWQSRTAPHRPFLLFTQLPNIFGKNIQGLMATCLTNFLLVAMRSKCMRLCSIAKSCPTCDWMLKLSSTMTAQASII